MGVWDYGLLDSDPALDIVELWEEYTAKYPEDGHTDVEEQCFERWGDAIRYGDSITNAEILALVALHLNNELPVSKRLRKSSIDAINRELVDEELENWEDPKKRKVILTTLLESLGDKIKRPRKPRFFRDPSLQYRSTEHANKQLMKIVREAAGQVWVAYMLNKQLYSKDMSVNLNAKIPPFLETLDRYMRHRIWEKEVPRKIIAFYTPCFRFFSQEESQLWTNWPRRT